MRKSERYWHYGQLNGTHKSSRNVLLNFKPSIRYEIYVVYRWKKKLPKYKFPCAQWAVLGSQSKTYTPCFFLRSLIHRQPTIWYDNKSSRSNKGVRSNFRGGSMKMWRFWKALLLSVSELLLRIGDRSRWHHKYLVNIWVAMLILLTPILSALSQNSHITSWKITRKLTEY